MAPAGVERRRDKRLELTLPVKFSTGAEGSLSLRDGMTRNVSTGGVFFETPLGQFAPADAVSLRIGIPARQHEDQVNLTLVGTGVVRRVEPLDPLHILGAWSETQRKQGVCGIALEFDQRPTVWLRSIEELLWEDHQR